MKYLGILTLVFCSIVFPQKNQDISISLGYSNQQADLKEQVKETTGLSFAYSHNIFKDFKLRFSIGLNEGKNNKKYTKENLKYEYGYSLNEIPAVLSLIYDLKFYEKNYAYFGLGVGINNVKLESKLEIENYTSSGSTEKQALAYQLVLGYERKIRKGMGIFLESIFMNTDLKNLKWKYQNTEIKGEDLKLQYINFSLGFKYRF